MLRRYISGCWPWLCAMKATTMMAATKCVPIEAWEHYARCGLVVFFLSSFTRGIWNVQQTAMLLELTLTIMYIFIVKYWLEESCSQLETVSWMCRASHKSMVTTALFFGSHDSNGLTLAMRVSSWKLRLCLTRVLYISCYGVNFCFYALSHFDVRLSIQPA